MPSPVPCALPFAIRPVTTASARRRRCRSPAAGPMLSPASSFRNPALPCLRRPKARKLRDCLVFRATKPQACTIITAENYGCTEFASSGMPSPVRCGFDLISPLFPVGLTSKPDRPHAEPSRRIASAPKALDACTLPGRSPLSMTGGRRHSSSLANIIAVVYRINSSSNRTLLFRGYHKVV